MARLGLHGDDGNSGGCFSSDGTGFRLLDFLIMTTASSMIKDFHAQ